MIKNTHLRIQLLLLLFLALTSHRLLAQARVTVTVVSVEVTQFQDCDNFLNGDSDFVWEYIATDNTLGRTNNNPTALGGLLGDFNHAYRNGNNGPYVMTSPGSTFTPSTGVFFDHEYVCPTDVPTQIVLDWRAYENDAPFPLNYDVAGLFADGMTASQTHTLAVTPSSSSLQTYTATSQGGGCNQTYNITFRVTHAPLNITYMEDDICNAIVIPVNNVSQKYGWCGNLSLETGEPLKNNMLNHGSSWFYFVAPSSGNVTIETDLSDTDFGTELIVYHAADGATCVQGSNNWVGFTGLNPIKSKFDYLSYQGNADDDIAVVNPTAKATAHFAEVLSVAPAVRDGHALIAGETYYIQLTTDQTSQRGYIAISIADVGGNPYRGIDIPCQGTDISNHANSTTVRTEANGMPESTQLRTNRVSDEELDAPYMGTVADNFSAYAYTSNPPNANSLNGSMWVKFIAPQSGRIYLEADLDNAAVNEVENLALYAPDNRFAAGQPADLFCSNIVQIAETEGGTGLLGATRTAILTERCLEPGYTYYGMVDPQAAALANEAEVWIYDPSVDDPVNNPPTNDILCLVTNNILYEVPVKPVHQVLPFQAVAGNNSNACIERLAGEPYSNSQASHRADQTVWHYFIAPPSGVVEMSIRAYIGMDTLNWAVYELLNGNDCYGGLNPATYTVDGTQSTPKISPLTSGITDFNGDQFGLCCLVPGRKYAIQIDGGSPGDEGQYIIEYIKEIEVYAGDAQYHTNNNDTFTYNIPDTSFVCFGDTLFPTIMVDALGNTTSKFTSCIGIGFMVHDSLNIPDSIVNGNFTFRDTVYNRPLYWVNNAAQSFTQNALHYVSPLADELATWGELVCPSASAENGVPFVFLSRINLVSSYNSNNCIIDFTASGGFPQYNGSNFNYTITNSLGDTVAQGTAANNALQRFSIPVADTYTIVVSDGMDCGQTVVVNANSCLNPCVNNPVIILPDPVDSTVYSCFPGGDSATVTILLTGGQPALTAGSNYSSTVSGSTAPSANGNYTTAGSANPTPFSFTVLDGDNWMVVVLDVNSCPDTITGIFNYNQTNCANYCQLNPITATFNYNCNTNGTALVEVVLSGGQPSIDGSNYSINISGSSVLGQNHQNAQLAGVVHGSANFSFVVDDGDSWQLAVMGTTGCGDTLQDNYLFDTAHCPICAMLPVQILPDPVDSNVYICYSDSSALVTLFLTGGDPFLNGTNYTVTVSGSSSAAQNGTSSQSLGMYQFTVKHGDNWQIIAIDNNACADTVTGTFNYSLSNCPDVCQVAPIVVGSPTYTCHGNATASVNISIGGGLPTINGSNYLVTVIGSTAGGSGYQMPLAGIINNSTTYSFDVADGDNWIVVVTDDNFCTDSISGTFAWNTTTCSGICNDPNYIGVTINGGTGSYTYRCDSLDNALLNLNLTGGLPQILSSNNYIADVTINGNTNSQTINSSGLLSLPLSDGDSWTVQVYDALGCDTAQLAGQFTSVTAVATTTASYNLLIGQFADLDGTASTGNISTYSWSPTIYITDPTADLTTVQPLASTAYTLMVSDTFGCSDTASVMVNVGSCVPAASGFTPNGDGTNDLWEIPCLMLFPNRVQVFNRWGQKVFEAENYDGTWNGQNLGQDVPDATYYYIIEVDYPNYNGPVLYKGTVSIIR